MTWVYGAAIGLLGWLGMTTYKRPDGSTRDGSQGADWETQAEEAPIEYTWRSFQKQGLKPSDLVGEDAQKYAEWLKKNS
jgi:hypothetical protein